MGDTSAAGMERALGLTANYVYRPRDVERNHEAYARDFQVVASPGLERLVKRSRYAEGSPVPGRVRNPASRRQTDVPPPIASDTPAGISVGVMAGGGRRAVE